MTRLPLPTEADLATRLRQGKITFPPLSLSWKPSTDKTIDGIVQAKWRKKVIRFAAECKRGLNPKSVAEAAAEIREKARKAKLQPLVVFPFLEEAALDRLEAEAVSGIDLCGNGIIVVPDELYLRRTGTPNPFRVENPIKNVYRGDSSTVARLFLAQPRFDSLQEALDELIRRGGRVTLATVSKVCKRLEDDLIIERKRGGVTTLRLVQADKLLDKLAASYVPPVVTNRVTGKLKGIEPAECRRVLSDWAKKTANQVALSGSSSVNAYAVMARSEVDEFYCSDVTDLLRHLGERFQPTERFATVVLQETTAKEVFFDRREDLTASPVQTYLELMNGDKRDQETALQVRKVILNTQSSG